jgi:broad-specificity NMP kinase/phosphoribosylaminoimidazole-succinocarboxamide synthase
MNFEHIVTIDGIDGSGKTTIVQLLTKREPSCYVNDRGNLTSLTLLHPSDLPEKFIYKGVYIILDASPSVCLSRINLRGFADKWASSKWLHYFHKYYRMLVSKYNLFYIDTTCLSIEETYSAVIDIIKNKNDKYKMPCPDLVTDDVFNSLQQVANGESKDVRLYNGYHLVKYIPSIYSHTQQRAGIVPGSDVERMKMTKEILLLFWLNGIDHSYIYVGKKYTLTIPLDNYCDIPPVEIIYKGCWSGSDKHRYYDLPNKIDRFGNQIVKSIFNGELYEYIDPYVRIDLRNPNHVDGRPWGDYNLDDILANKFIDLCVKTNALKTASIIKNFLLKINIYLVDCCFMYTSNGKMLYGEFSQDCGRYKYIGEDQLDNLDKDIWRAGGSSDLVLEKYKKMSSLVENGMKKHLSDELKNLL